jgi:L-lysine exporter family protein LysE/ArgO
MMFTAGDFLGGLGTGLALIAAIGTQNAMLLRAGIRRDNVLWLVLVCALSDVVLIAAGVAGMGALVQAAPQLITAVKWIGAIFLFCYGILSLKRGLLGGPEALAPAPAPEDTVDDDAAAASASVAGRRLGLSHRAKLILTMLALTWLNPHVYLDTLVFLGSAAAAHGDGRWAFGLGAMLASILWFSAIGFGARLLAPVFARPLTWRILDTGVGMLMFVLGVKILLD